MSETVSTAALVRHKSPTFNCVCKEYSQKLQCKCLSLVLRTRLW